LANCYNKTRIAPTPSGFLHLGNVLSFAITATLARQSSAKILLRIDDLDRPRVNNEYLQDIFDTLNFLEIPWDEGPRNVQEFEESYSQQHRMPLYQEVLQQLHNTGLVFACTCSRKQLHNNEANCTCFSHKIPLSTKNASWRLSFTNNNSKLEVKSSSGQIIYAALPAEMHHFVVKKKDSFPSYQLTSLVDDLFYGIDLVVRGEDLWPSTLAQHQLAQALENNRFGDITFYHHPLLLETSGQKLSKSAGSTSVHYLRQDGKTPAAIYTMIAEMLGINRPVHNWQQLAEAVLPVL
jgi:glutamyl/glutaminyl-tRNA synthetase